MAAATTEREIEEKRDASQKEGFAKVMAFPTIRLLVSMVPAAERPEVLETLLKEVYLAGHAHGEGLILGEVLQTMMKKGFPG